MKGETSVIDTLLHEIKEAPDREQVELNFMLDGIVYPIDQVEVMFKGERVIMYFKSTNYEEGGR